MALDTLTHAMSGALLARGIVPYLSKVSAPTLRRALIVGGVSAAFPDSDLVISLVSDQLTYLNLHRGITHSLIMMPLWAMLLASIFSLLDRNRGKWRSYFVLALGGIAIHITGDVITIFGTQIFAPFSSWKASLPFTFIIDPWFSGIIIAGLLASWWWSNSARPAQLSLLVLACYVGFQAMMNTRAAALGEQYAESQGYRGVQVVAFPQPLSPFNWKIVVSTQDRYDVAYVNLHRSAAIPQPEPGSGLIKRLNAVYQPASRLTWQQETRFGNSGEQRLLSQEAWEAPVMAPARRFIEYPALAQINHRKPEGTCVWFDDLRFTIADIRTPFRFGACRNHQQSDWQLYRLVDNHPIPQ